uniref:Thioredoxin domain-containing protein n=1 Tax=viral metagenome TaxID=1070528 RepID=A0A6C0I696_9ZZZZ
MNNQHNQNIPTVQYPNNIQTTQPVPETSNNTSEIQEYFNYVNAHNNMNLKRIILFYSKYSKICEQFINSLHPNYKVILNMISVDNPQIRKRLMNSKYKLQYVPCILMLFDNGKVNMHNGNELLSLVTFLNKNMEAYMVIKTNENIAKRKMALNGRTPIMANSSDANKMSQMDEIVNLPQNKKLKESKMRNLPRIKQPIPEDFNKSMDVGISSRRMIPKGRKEHKKMAHTSLTPLETNRELDTIEEENEDDTTDEEDNNIEMEDAEILDNILEEQQDNTIDPIISSKNKKDIKDIAAEMAKERGPVDDKPMMKNF